MFAQGAFQIDPNLSPEEVAARRERLAANRPRYGQARFIGEGIGQLGQGIAEGFGNRKLNKIERAGRAGADSLFDRIMGRQGQGGGMSILGMPPDNAAMTPQPVTTMTESEAIANDAMAALGQPNQDERDLLAKTLMAEAGGEGVGGMLAAGAVIKNRVGAGGYGDGLKGVIMKPGQFSAWNGVTGYAGGKGALDMGGIKPSADAYRVADLLLSGQYEDPTRGATHYYNPAAANPKWGQQAGGDWTQIGNHIFGSADAGRGGGQPSGGQPNQLNDLYEALQNPWLNQSQKGVLMQMIADEKQRTDPAAQLDMEYKRAQLDALRNPQEKPAPRPMTVQDRTAWGIPPEDNRPYALVDGKPTLIGGSGVTVNNSVGAGETEYDKTIGKGFAEKYNAIQDGANTARGKLDTLNALGAALDESGTTGFGAETLMGVKRAAKSLGLDIGENLGPQETAIALGNQLALMLRSPSGGAGMPGAMSEKDRQFLVASVPGLGKTPQGNRQLLDYMRKVEQRNIEVAARAQDYAQTHGRLDAGFDRELAAWADANPLFGDAATDAMPDNARAVIEKYMQENGITGKTAEEVWLGMSPDKRAVFK